nr:ORF2 [Torque teno felis virus]
MQKPLPGPNLMLPVLDLNKSPDPDHSLAYKKREAVFKRQVSELHANWCLCGSYLNHFLPSNQPLRASESCGGEGDVGGLEGGVLSVDSITEEDFRGGIEEKDK